MKMFFLSYRWHAGKRVDHFVAHSKHQLNSLLFDKRIILIIHVLFQVIYIQTAWGTRITPRPTLSKLKLCKIIKYETNGNKTHCQTDANFTLADGKIDVTKYNTKALSTTLIKISCVFYCIPTTPHK